VRAPKRRVFLESRAAVVLAGALIALAVLGVYYNSYQGPFILDDLPAISENPSIMKLWPLTGPLSPPTNGQTVTGRPLVNLTLAVNYAFGGLNVWGYHAVNVGIHALAALVFFGIARRTFLQAGMREKFGRDALALAWVIALLWAVHPLTTESVTYMIQRAEALMALFYLLTLYLFIRGVEAARPWRWLGWSIAACLAGMACKEVMVSAPLIVLLYDRTFVAGTFREAWRQRWRYYAGLAATWALLAWLVARVGNRGASAGYGAGVDWREYALTQFSAITRYLWLSFWPQPLVLDYGNGLASGAAEIAPYAAFIALLVAGTVYALWRRPVPGFCGAAFFAILAPSSSVVPVVTQTIAEHRMYLPLTVVLAAAVAGLFLRRGRWVLPGCLALAAVYGTLTVQRNDDYHTAVAIWQDDVAKRPNNARAHENLAINLVAEGGPHVLEGISEYYKALQLLPDYAEAHSNLGNALGSIGRTDEAIEHYKAAVKLVPTLTAAHYNMANALAGAGRLNEAVAEYGIAVQLTPDFAPAHNNLGNALNSLGRMDEAEAQYREAVRLNPSYAVAQNNLGNVLFARKLYEQARAQYQLAAEIDPNYVDAHYWLGNALVMLGRSAEAIPEYEKALGLKPDFPDAVHNLAIAKAQAAAANGTSAKQP